MIRSVRGKKRFGRRVRALLSNTVSQLTLVLANQSWGKGGAFSHSAGVSQSSLHRGAPGLAARAVGRSRHSHVSASVVMALFVGGSGLLSVLPELPEAHSWLVPHTPQRIALGPPHKSTARIVEASVSATAQSLLLDAWKPNVADDLTQAQAMPETTTVTVRPGDTLSELLTEAGIAADDAREAVSALRPHYDPRQIKSGQDILLTMGPPPSSEDEPEQGRRLLGFSVQADPTTHVEVERNDQDDFVANVTQAKLTEHAVRATAKIDSSLFIAAEDAGIPNAIIVDLIRMFSYDIDFQRDIQKGDTFEVYFTRMMTDDKRVISNGRILFAALTTGGRTHKLWRYSARDDSMADYYDETGRNSKKSLMRTPIDGARLTSGYGMRMHPVLGYTKMHKGVDFGAPIGTPVMAAGGGTIEFASPYSTYGNYIRIRHTNGFKTAYAHLKGFARGIKVGAHVMQGQTIGYVGMSGRSTGPHLHYEVLVRDHQVNPMGVKVATGEQLEGKDLVAFRQTRATISDQLANAERLGASTTASLGSTSEAIAR